MEEFTGKKKTHKKSRIKYEINDDPDDPGFRLQKYLNTLEHT